MNAADVLRVDVGERLRDPGSRRSHRDSVHFDGLAVSTASVPDGTPVELDLEIEAIGEEIVVEGNVAARWHGECRRCLQLVSSGLEVPVREIFERRPVEGETYKLGDEDLGEDVIDLAPMIRDALVLALPLAPLCSEDCAGPDPERFPAVAGDEDAEGSGSRDPRWAALDELRLEDLPAEGDE